MKPLSSDLQARSYNQPSSNRFQLPRTIYAGRAFERGFCECMLSSRTTVGLASFPAGEIAMRLRAKLIASATCLALVFLSVQALPAELQVMVFDVGQADATLVTCPDGNHHLLIDSGDTRYPGSSKKFRERMEGLFPDDKRQLDVVVASHPHQDHIGSMSWVLENFEAFASHFPFERHCYENTPI
jgi:beta-lactamase superfamily II metal-dependent hydrolase